MKDTEVSLCGVPMHKHNPLCPTCYPEKSDRRKEALELFKELFGGSNDRKRS